MRIMSERRFQAELAKAKEEIYKQEQADKRMMEIYHRFDKLQRDYLDLRCKIEGRQDARATTEVRE